MEVSLKQARVGMLLAAAAGIAFGSAPVGTVFQLRSFEPLAAAMWRAGIGAVVLGLVVGLRAGATHRLSLRDLDGPAFRRLIVLGFLGGPTFLFGLNIAVSEVGASISGLVTGMYAVFAAVIAPYLLKEPLEMRAIGGLILAMGGTIMLAALDVGGVGLVGVGAGMLGAASNAFYLVLGRKWIHAHRLPPEAVALSFATMAALTFLVYVGLTDAAALWPDDVRTDSLIALFYLAAVLVGGQLLMMAAVKRLHSRRSASLLLLNPVTAAVLGAWILDERLTGPQLAGAILVLLGIALGSGVTVTLRRRRRSEPVEDPGAA